MDYGLYKQKKYEREFKPDMTDVELKEIRLKNFGTIKKIQQVPEEEKPFHGSDCTCEICWKRNIG